LEDFLYEAIFTPEGMAPLPRDVIHRPELYHYIMDFGKQGDVCCVCEDGGRIVGAAWSRILDAPNNKGYGNVGAGIPELSVSVLSESRGRGIGTELLKRLHAALAELGYERISLSVQKANPALRLYARMGYSVVKEQETDYIMAKRLDGKEEDGERQNEICAGNLAAYASKKQTPRAADSGDVDRERVGRQSARRKTFD
jgi:ribosomal protein S18 acetylase RimI-like enzyme